MNVGHGLQYGGYDRYIIPMNIHDSKEVGTDCNMAEYIRKQDRYYTSVMNRYLLLDMPGHDIDPTGIKAARNTDHVFHSDSKVYDYGNLPTDQYPH